MLKLPKVWPLIEIMSDNDIAPYRSDLSYQKRTYQPEIAIPIWPGVRWRIYFTIETMTPRTEEARRRDAVDG